MSRFPRRGNLHAALGLLVCMIMSAAAVSSGLAATVRVLVWDEQQPAQKQAYDQFLGHEIVSRLAGRPGLDVRGARLEDPGQGLAPDALDRTDVLVWWGHVRHGEVSDERVADVVRRVKSGRLALVALHSAHWSKPFVSLMNERARADALHPLSAAERERVTMIETNQYVRFFTPPRFADPRTPSVLYRKHPDDRVEVVLTLPNCCFPAYRGDGKPGHVRVLQPGHPIARGLPGKFVIPQTEMYCEPFHVPAPDEVVLEERWEGGEWFRSGMVWAVGDGKVFYFRPGHETYPVFKQPEVIQTLENAVRWLGEGVRR